MGNETAGASTPEEARTAVKWSDHSQMTSLTVGGRTYAGQYGSTDQSERVKLGDPVNRIDPRGTLSLGGVMDTVGTVGDVIAVGEFAGQVASGDYESAAGTALSFAADKGFTAGCTYLTGGAGAVPCAVGGMAVGEATEQAYGEATG
ncbi:hypothetical protein [Streptomyces sp. NPDC086147]|uniref:hypothetical protein n=1 Tax=Streptomyces sp. NPDC086147 TaxID=3155295 RepID=UPI00344B780E